jgi:aspartyl/asparaginyl beta-hydroxylase (cupin superfamily)
MCVYPYLADGALISEEQWFERILQNDQEALRLRFTQMTSESLASLVPQPPTSWAMQRISSIDVRNLVAELQANNELFKLSTRQRIKVQEHTETIHFSKPDYRDTPLKTNCNVQDTVPTAHCEVFPIAASLLEQFARMQGKGILSMAMVVRLKPGAQVHPHYDRGLYYAVRDRYHLVLESQGSEMTCGGETEIWHKGEIWWFNNKLRHSAQNIGTTWRTHLIFDILPHRNLELCQRMKAWANSRKVE